MKWFEEDTIKYLRFITNVFDDIPDEILINVYRRFSNKYFSVNWISTTEQNARDFIKYATTTPIEKALDICSVIRSENRGF